MLPIGGVGGGHFLSFNSSPFKDVVYSRLKHTLALKS